MPTVASRQKSPAAAGRYTRSESCRRPARGQTSPLLEQDPRSLETRSLARLKPRRKPLPKNAEILSSWLDYKSTTRVRTKVPKSLAKRPRSSKPLTIRGLHLSAATWRPPHSKPLSRGGAHSRRRQASSPESRGLISHAWNG